MKRFINELCQMSLSRLYNLVSKPWKIPIILSRPPTLSDRDAISTIFTSLKVERVEGYKLEFLRNNVFFEELNKKMVEIRHRRVKFLEWQVFLYLAVRVTRPRIVFETGVFDGLSSAVILQALYDNDNGVLVSFDLPAYETIIGATHCMIDTTLPLNCQPGWVIPEYLRKRHRLILGDSKELLQKIFIEYPQIDIFLHDSLHTFEHQYFEYTIAWQHLVEGGLLMSDDIFWSSAFHKFAKENNKNYVCVGSFGAIVK